MSLIYGCEINCFWMFYFQQPFTIVAQKKFNPARDPCSVTWDVLWDDLMTMELTLGKKEHPSAPPSRVILYLQSRSQEAKDQFRIIKCNRDSSQAMEIYSSIEKARTIYGRNQSKVKFVVVSTLSLYLFVINKAISRGTYPLSVRKGLVW